MSIISGTTTRHTVTGRELLSEGWCVLDSNDDHMLQAWILFCVAVAGKTAKTTTRAINNFLSDRRVDEAPFDYIGYLVSINRLEHKLKEHRVGQYSKLVRAFDILSRVTVRQLRTWSPEEFENIPGIGPKTSRFFIQSTREDTRFAVLDVHILGWLKDLGYIVPKSTPSSKKYQEIEKLFLKLCDERDISPRELDAQVWLSRARV
jgi:thermostable 8-oxoguanine DNA glycosylase